MTTEILKTLFTRDLNKLHKEIAAYQDESVIWKTIPGIANPAGNLCLHLVGNLNAYIGKQLGGTDYVRNRDLEFSLKDIPRDELLRMIQDTREVIAATLSHLPEAELEKEYPQVVFEEKMSTAFFLTHLCAHLAYHLGQINYHRRMLEGGVNSGD